MNTAAATCGNIQIYFPNYYIHQQPPWIHHNVPNINPQPNVILILTLNPNPKPLTEVKTGKISSLGRISPCYIRVKTRALGFADYSFK